MTNAANGHVRLSKTSVAKAQPGPKRYKLHDSDVAGFHLVVSPSGRKSFYLRYRVCGDRGGAIREPKIGDLTTMTPEQARKITRDWQAEIRAGGDPGGKRQRERSAPVMSVLCERYLRDHADLHKNGRRRDLCRNWPDNRVDEAGSADCICHRRGVVAELDQCGFTLRIRWVKRLA